MSTRDWFSRCLLAFPIAALGAAALAQSSAEPAEAMAKLGPWRGVWVGQASGVDMRGERYAVTQTERVGPMLGGQVMVIEGRAYRPDGVAAFNAMAVVSWDPTAKAYEFRSYAMGHAGTFKMTASDTGFVWELPAGPGSIRYTIVVDGGVWRETGEAVFPGRPPTRIYEANLKRVRDTDWPLGTPISPAGN